MWHDLKILRFCVGSGIGTRRRLLRFVCAEPTPFLGPEAHKYSRESLPGFTGLIINTEGNKNYGLQENFHKRE